MRIADVRRTSAIQRASGAGLRRRAGGAQAPLKRARISAVAVVPEKSKQARASVETSKFKSGRVLLPKRARRLCDFEAESLAFPEGRHDDQVDSMRQALAYDLPGVTMTKIRF